MIGSRRNAQRDLPPSQAEGHAIDGRVFGRDVDAHRIDVRGRQSGARPEVARGKGEQPRPRADIRDVIEAEAAGLHPVEHLEAAMRGFMPACPKGLARLDQEGPRPQRRRRVMGGCMDIEAPGMHRLEPGLTDCQPVLIRQIFKLGPCLRGTRDERLDERYARLVGLAFEIGIEFPMVGPGLVWLAHDKRGRRLQQRERGDIRVECFGFGAGAGQGELPAVRHGMVHYGLVALEGMP